MESGRASGLDPDDWISLKLACVVAGLGAEWVDVPIDMPARVDGPTLAAPVSAAADCKEPTDTVAAEFDPPGDVDSPAP